MDSQVGLHDGTNTPTSADRFRIGAALIDPRSRYVECAGIRERLQPQLLKVLMVLARHKGDVVSRAELVDRCWDGRVVGDDVINRVVLLLRGLARRTGGFKIETVPRFGYRLIETEVTPSRPRWWMLSTALTIIAAFTLLSDTRDHEKQGQPPVPTVALQRFVEASGDQVEHGLALASRDSLSSALAEGGFPIRMLETSMSDPTSVDFIISGDVRHNKDKVEVVVRLEETHHHTIIFMRNFAVPVDQVANLPEQIGPSVATILNWTGAFMVLDRRHPSDPAVTAELFKQLSITVVGGDLLSAYAISRRIAPHSPNSAIAQLSLAMNTSFVVSDLPLDQRASAVKVARVAAGRARQLAPEFGDVYLPWCGLHSPLRLLECEQSLRDGLHADPDAPFVTAFLSSHLDSVGRVNESLELARLALANDPYKPAKLARLIRSLEATGNRDEAERVYNQATRWWPDYSGLAWMRLVGMLQRGDDAAAEAFEARISHNPLDRPAANSLFAALRTGDRLRAQLTCAATGLSQLTRALCMTSFSRLGELDSAFSIARALYPSLKGASEADEDRRWLENTDGAPLALLSAPSAAALRQDPRFIAMADGVGLLAYWRSGRLPDFCRAPAEPVCSKLTGAVAR